jgi:hypothetical protein
MLCSNSYHLISYLQTVKAEGIAQPAFLGILRSDYMLHSRENDDRNMLQVEINTISSSFGSLSTQLTEMFSYMNGRHSTGEYSSNNQIPANSALTNVVSGLAAAHNHVLSQCLAAITTEHDPHRYCVAMIVQGNERNFSDQRLIEYGKKYEVMLVLRTHPELTVRTRAFPDSRRRMQAIHACRHSRKRRFGREEESADRWIHCYRCLCELTVISVTVTICYQVACILAVSRWVHSKRFYQRRRLGSKTEIREKFCHKVSQHQVPVNRSVYAV